MLANSYQLPLNVTSRSDVGRLQFELDSVDNFLEQASIRQPGTSMSSMQMPKTSRLFEEIVSLNKLNMLQKEDRKSLNAFLKHTFEHAPLLHISFQNDPSPLFLQKLNTWLREKIHPQLLLQIGLRPGLGAGCVIRTTNKYFDFSLRQFFDDNKRLLTKQLQNVDKVSQPAPRAEAP